MTQRRLLEERLGSLHDSGGIIRSMKNLAFMETRKLGRLIEQQRGVVRQINAVAEDFLAFFPQTLPAAAAQRQVCLVIGSRRGFCGDFNERLALHLRQQRPAEGQGRQTAVIAVGHRLCRRLESESDIQLDAALDGADVADEVPSVMRAVVDELDRQRNHHGAITLRVLYHRADEPTPLFEPLLPPFEIHPEPPQRHPFAPQINLAPRDFLIGLVEQYLFAALHAVLFESLLAENERRVRHLEGAVRHLDQQVANLQRRVQVLRQEEIIEEIEVILLNATQLDAATTPSENADAP
jgi:F-type H+-transporting ATPase subunit gamma